MSRAAQQVSLKRQGVVFIQSRLYPFKLLERWEHIEILQLFGKSVLEKKNIMSALLCCIDLIITLCLTFKELFEKQSSQAVFFPS